MQILIVCSSVLSSILLRSQVLMSFMLLKVRSTLSVVTQRRLRTIKIPCIASHTEHAHHIHLAYKFIHSLCGDMLTQWVAWALYIYYGALA